MLAEWIYLKWQLKCSKLSLDIRISLHILSIAWGRWGVVKPMLTLLQWVIRELIFQLYKKNNYQILKIICCCNLQIEMVLFIKHISLNCQISAITCVSIYDNFYILLWSIPLYCHLAKLAVSEALFQHENLCCLCNLFIAGVNPQVNPSITLHWCFKISSHSWAMKKLLR